jgi:hypothetical protein
MASADLRKAWVCANLNADLIFILEDCEVDELLQYEIGQHYRSIKKFSSAADTRAEVRTMCTQDFALDPTAGADVRAKIATIVSAWECTRDYITKENSLKAESKVLGIPRVVSYTDRAAMKKAVENAFARIPDKECPGPTYIATKVEEIEQNEPTAAPLDEIESCEDSLLLGLQSSLDATGRLRVTKTKTKGKMPATTEELRTKLRVESNLWLFLGAKFKNRTWLQGLTPADFSAYTDYLLGHKVNGLMLPRSDGAEGTSALNPPWNVLLNYDYAMRRAAFKEVREDPTVTLQEALRRVVRDVEIKELSFTSIISLSRKSSIQLPDAKRQRATSSGRQIFDGKSGGKGGRGKSGKGRFGKGNAGKGRGGPKLAYQTPDGRSICFAFNSEGCPGSCGMAHVCRIPGCFKEHPMSAHK